MARVAKPPVDITKTPDILRRFQCTEFAKGGDGVGSQGNNKFYVIKAWDTGGGTYFFRAEYGKVGQETNPAIDEKEGVPLSWIEGKAHEKLYKKNPPYREVDLHQVTASVQLAATPAADVTSDPKVVALVSWLFSQAGEAISKFLRGRVESLSISQIATGRRLLHQIRGAWQTYQASPSVANEQALAALVRDYFNAIPTQLPRRLDQREVVQDLCNNLADHEQRLDQLEAAIQTTQATGGGQTQLVSLGSEIQLLPQSDPRYTSLVDFVQTRANHGYICKVKDIFAINLPGAKVRWDGSQRGKSNVKLLTHGSRSANWRHILKDGGPSAPGGLRLPQFHNNGVANGSMFGPGLYFANQATKSGNYCGSTWMDVRGREQYGLLLCDVALGNGYVPRGSDSSLNLDRLQRMGGYDSVTAIGGQSGVANNEFIVFDAAQHRPRFFVTWERSDQ